MMRLLFLLLLALHIAASARAAERPNIVWIVIEDMSAHFACYGEKTIATPALDALAAEGSRFTRAFTTAPICSISRSALITGRYQTSIGAQNHRSSVPGHEIHLPADTPLVPVLLRNAGYHVNNLTLQDFLRPDSNTAPVRAAKTDYNFEWDEPAAYDSTHWSARDKSKPFFVQVQLTGGKYRGQAPGDKFPARVKEVLGSVTDPATVQLPPWLPDDPVIRADWAQYLDTVRMTDHETAQIIARLRESGDLASTVIFLFTDHGISHVRAKQFLYDAGTHVPLIVKGPGIAAGKTRTDLVELMDVAAASLALAGIPRPAAMQAQPILSPDYQPRKYVFAARDRADETVDLIRSVRSERWKYIRNGFPSRPYLQPNLYKDGKAIVQAMRRLHAEGKLNAAQAKIMAETRPKEELYDLESDPHELNNLAADPARAAVLSEMRTALSDWQQRTGDPGKPETAEVYRAETGATHAEGGRQKDNPAFKKNVELMLRWLTEKPLE